MERDRKGVYKIAKKRAKYKMSLGLLALCGNFSFVFAGTYYIWSWDIVEPIAYFISLFGSVILTSQYFKLKQDYDNTTYHEYISNKELVKIAPRYGLDLDEFEQVKDEINYIRGKLKTSILIDL